MNVVSIDVCGFYISLYGCYRVLGDISFLSFYCLYGWCAMHNGFMHIHIHLHCTSPHLFGLFLSSGRRLVVLPVEFLPKLPQKIVGIQTGGEWRGRKHSPQIMVREDLGEGGEYCWAGLRCRCICFLILLHGLNACPSVVVTFGNWRGRGVGRGRGLTCHRSRNHRQDQSQSR